MKIIKTILFDYAGVITPVRNNYQFALKYGQRFSLKPEVLMKITYENWADAATGKLDCQTFWSQMADRLSIDPEELRDLVIGTFPIDNRMINIIRKTHIKYTTVLFSNQIKDWIEKVIEDNNIKDIFDHLINSYTVGVRKPDKRIFLEALKRTSTSSEQTLFIDNSVENIEAARELGFNTIHFQNFDQFLEEYLKYIDIKG